ncbi:MAG: hypothetical protein Q8O67_14075 [Deltaproteobacteria bacterium]|nr:hypothetical protein [Deltaproteobacteria bacterium]
MTSTALGQANVGRRQLDPAARQRLATAARDAAATLHMILRSVKVYDLENELFREPFLQLQKTVNDVVASDRSFVLNAIGTVLQLNGVVVPVDFGALEMLRALTDALKAAGLGGFAVAKPIEISELKRFVSLFQGSMSEAEKENVKKTISIGVRAWGDIKLDLDRVSAEEIEKSKSIDRNKYAFTVYARAVAFTRGFFTPQPQGTYSLAPAARIVCDIVDLARSGDAHLLGMCPKDENESPPYHAANTCLLASLLGVQLDLPRERLLDLGRAALLWPLVATTAGPKPAISFLSVRPLDVSVLTALAAAREAQEPLTESTSALARVLRIAEAFDRLTTPGVPHGILTAAEAIEEMRRGVDPTVLFILEGVLARQRLEKVQAPSFMTTG